MNRTNGLDAILDEVEVDVAARHGGQFDDITEVDPGAAMAAQAARYEAVPGSGIDTPHASPRTLDNGAHFRAHVAA